MIDQVKKEVSQLLNNDTSGHAMDHINRVLDLSLKFSSKEGANKDIVSLIALLHDVDDHKLVGESESKNLTNTKRILNLLDIEDKTKEIIISEVSSIGYSKYLCGIRPKTLEGMIVSDADMCDGLGAIGIIRSTQYNIKCGNPFFEEDRFPKVDMTKDEYINGRGNVINHLFEKILKLKSIMLTSSGKLEASKRHEFVVRFLYQYFEEINAKDWKEYLDNYLKEG